MPETTTVSCPDCGAPARRFCSRCGALAVHDDPETESTPTTPADETAPTEPLPPEQLRRGSGRPIAAAAFLVLVLAGVAVGLSRTQTEQVTAWGPRGGWEATGVTSDTAPRDLSSTLWTHDLAHWSLATGPPGGVTDLSDTWILTGERLVALDPVTFAVQWTSNVRGDGSGAVTSEGITVVTRDELLVLSPVDGSITARTPLADSVPSTVGAQLPTVVGDLAIVPTQSGVRAIRRNNGKTAWAHQVEGWTDLLAATPERVLVGTRERVRALDTATGRPRWAFEVPADDAWISHWFQLVDDTVLISIADGLGGGLVGLELTDGGERWHRETDSPADLVLREGDRVLLRPTGPAGDQELFWVDARNGAIQPGGTMPADTPRAEQAVFLTAGDMLVPSESGLRRIIDGAPVWSAPAGGWQQPLVHDGVVFTGGREGVAVLDLATGERIGGFTAPQRHGGDLLLSGEVLSTGSGPDSLLDVTTGEPWESAAPQGWLGPGGTLAPWGVLRRGPNQSIVAYDHTGEEQWRHESTNGTDQGLIAALEEVVLLYEFRPPQDRNEIPGSAPHPELVVIDAGTGEEVDREASAPAPTGFVTDSSSIWTREWSFDPAAESALVRYDLDPTTGALELAWRVPASPGHLILSGDHLLDIAGSSLTVRHPEDGTAERVVELPAIAGGAPVVTAGMLIVDDGDSTLHALDPDGEPGWSSRVGASIVGDPVAAGGLLYVATADGAVVVIDTASGEHVDRIGVTDGAASASLIVARGMLLVRFDATVYALGDPRGASGADPSPVPGALQLPG